jgi:thiol-disulfide isomerase/thioredoxin
VASNAEQEAAGNDEYRDDHMGAIFREGFSFSGYERDYVGLNLGGDASGSPATGDGAPRYLAISGITGIDSISDGRGAAFADFDNDGDTDIFMVALQGNAHHLFRNDIGQDANFLRIELLGTESGRDAFGAVVRVKTSAGVLTKLKSGGSGFLSQHDPRLLFGLGKDDHAEWVEVTWPSGATQRFVDVAADRAVRIVEEQDLRVVDERRFRLVDPLGAEDALLAKLTVGRGEALPDLRLERIDGGVASLSESLTTGRRTLVNIWATWCIPCRKEMPELQRLRPGLEASGIDLIGLSIDVETRDRVPAFLDSLGIDYPSFIADADQVAGLFRGAAVFVPMSILLDDRGRIQRVFGGWSAETAAALEALIGAAAPPEAETGRRRRDP